jgi:outer membrane protein TolC
MKWRVTVPSAGAALLSLAGCAVHPAGEEAERARAHEAGKDYEDDARPPALPDRPGPMDYLRHAFFANGALRARYWDWRAALEQIPQDASPPNAALSFGYLFGGASMKAWDRTTLGIGNEPMSMIPFPTKLAAAGRRALEQARAAGLRFEAEKFALQGRVLIAYADLALLAESIRIREEQLALLRTIVELAAVRVRSGGGMQQDLLKAQTDVDLADNALRALRARVPAAAARLNALAGRPADAPAPPPDALPPPRPLGVADADLIRIGSERSPELAALARDVAGREEALALAKQAYLPDLGLSFSVTGSVSRMLEGMATLPLRLEAIGAGIEQARAWVRAAEASKAQYARDVAAGFVLNLAVLRDAERQAALYETVLIPRARQTVQLVQTAYAANRATFLDLVDAERMLLDLRLTAAELRTARERALAAIETWSAVDAETLGPAGAMR